MFFEQTFIIIYKFKKLFYILIYNNNNKKKMYLSFKES